MFWEPEVAWFDQMKECLVGDSDSLGHKLKILISNVG